VTPLYPQKLALTSPTGGGRSVGIVRVRTKATEFSFITMHGQLNVKYKIHILYDTVVTTGLLRNFGSVKKTIQDLSYVTLKSLRNTGMRKQA